MHGTSFGSSAKMNETVDIKWVKCQRSVEDLLKYLETETAPDHALVVKGLMDTRSCDYYTHIGANLSAVRVATARYLNRNGDPTLADRVTGGETLSPKDIKIINDASVDYKTWYIRELATSLSLSNRANYQLTDDSIYHYLGLATAMMLGFGACTLAFGRG
jgi:hypothetical protein